jgi:uncharacterized membrane protein YhaH (DUF805 family)
MHPVLLDHARAQRKAVARPQQVGMWLFTFYLLPFILDRMAEDAGAIGIVLLLASAALTIWALVEFGFLRGTAGPNHYGPDPLISA